MGNYSYTQSSFAGGVWAPSLWHRFQHEQYSTSVRECENFCCELHGVMKKRTGLKFSHAPKVSAYNGTGSRLYTFKYKNGASFILEFGHLTLRFFDENGPVMSGPTPLEIVTPFTSTLLRTLRFTQNENALWINTITLDEYVLTNTGGSGSWTFTTPTYTASVAPPTGLSGSPGGTTYQIAVSSVAANDEESVTTSLTSPLVMNSGGTATWNVVSGAVRYNVYQYVKGLWQALDVVGQPTSGSTVSWVHPGTSITPDPDKGPMTRYNYLSGSGNHPTCSTFYQQRKFSANTENNPKRIVASRTGNPYSYDASSPHIDTDAIVANIVDTDYNQIKFLVPAKKLVALGETGEYLVGSSNANSEGITATNITAPCVTRVGCGDCEPQMIDSSILFFNTSNQELNQYAYNLASDGYEPVSLSIMAQHLFDEDSAVEVSFSRKKLPRLFVITDTGRCYVFLYSRANKIAGWFEFKTSGTFESVATMKRTGKKDRIYFVVNRGESIGRTIEYLEDENFADETTGFYLDCGVSKTNVTAFTSVPTPHLPNGTAVTGLIDGYVVRGLVVASGAVVVPSCNVAHIGLEYYSFLRTISPIIPLTNSLADKRGSIISAIVRIQDTRELLYGHYRGEDNEYVLRGTDDGQSTNLATTSADITFGADSRLDSDVFFSSKDPVPCNIQSITYNVEANGI